MTCPLCDAPAWMLERMCGLETRRFCNGCGYLFTLSESGAIVLWQSTTHVRTAPRALLSRFIQPYTGAMHVAITRASVAEPRK